MLRIQAREELHFRVQNSCFVREDESEADDAVVPGGSVRGERANFTRLVLGWLAELLTGIPDESSKRLYRSQIVQVNTRRKALAEIYTMQSFAPFSNLKRFVKNC